MEPINDGAECLSGSGFKFGPEDIEHLSGSVLTKLLAYNPCQA